MAVVELSVNTKEAYHWNACRQVMLRLDPGDERIRATRSFRVWGGGSKYNVGSGLRRYFNRGVRYVQSEIHFIGEE